MRCSEGCSSIPVRLEPLLKPERTPQNPASHREPPAGARPHGAEASLGSSEPPQAKGADPPPLLPFLLLLLTRASHGVHSVHCAAKE